MGAGEALGRPQHRNAACLQSAGQGLGVAHDLGHIGRAEGERLGRGQGQSGDAIDLMGGRPDREDAVVTGSVRAGSSHRMMPDCGPLKVLPADPVRISAPSRSGSWNWPPPMSPI
jgi:hypothetical protein